MASQFQNQTYLKALQAQTELVLRNAESLLAQIASRVHSGRVELLNGLFREVDDLALMIAHPNRPSWLRTLLKVRESYQPSIISSELIKRLPELVQDIAAAAAEAKGYQWGANVEGGVDFDEIYQSYRSKSRIDELVDKLISTLEKIAALPDCDSAKLQTHLAQIIATLKRSKKASWAGAVSSWKMIGILLKHLTFNVLKKVTGADVLMDTAQATYTEIATEVQKVQQNTAISASTLAEQQILTLPPSLQWLDDAQRQSALPSPQEGDPEVIDAEFEKK